MSIVDLFVLLQNLRAQEKIVRAAHERARIPPKLWGAPPLVAPWWGQTEHLPPAWRQVMAVERDEGRLQVVNHREHQWLDPYSQTRLGWGNMAMVERFDTRGPAGCLCNDPRCPNNA